MSGSHHDLIRSKYWFRFGTVYDSLITFAHYTKGELSDIKQKEYIQTFLHEDVYYEPSADLSIQDTTINFLSAIQAQFNTNVPFLTVYGNLVQLAYISDMIRSRPKNIIESDPRRLRKLMKALDNLIDDYMDEEVLTHLIAEESNLAGGREVVRSVVRSFHTLILNLKDLVFSKHCPQYQSSKTMQNLEVYRKELIEATWHPKRIKDWCIDEDEKMDIWG